MTHLVRHSRVTELLLNIRTCETLETICSVVHGQQPSNIRLSARPLYQLHLSMVAGHNVVNLTTLH